MNSARSSHPKRNLARMDGDVCLEFHYSFIRQLFLDYKTKRISKEEVLLTLRIMGIYGILDMK